VGVREKTSRWSQWNNPAEKVTQTKSTPIGNEGWWVYFGKEDFL
jgi:hypothetical protein